MVNLINQIDPSMKRIHLFEIEDFAWFPRWLRDPMTHYLVSFHRMIGSAGDVAGLLDRALQRSQQKSVIDLCSGGGGPMPEVQELLKKNPAYTSIPFTLTDLYPNTAAAKRIAAQANPNLRYRLEPVDATAPPADLKGVRTMVGSFHHMTPAMGQKILKSAFHDRQPILIFEPSDNSSPKALWWTAFPFGIIATLLLTPMVRPMTWQQLVFTYLIPVLPICIAWDGAVSNARIYTKGDFDELLKGLEAPDYEWEYGVIKNRVKKSYLLGMPKA
jgi:hypothetical protein